MNLVFQIFQMQDGTQAVVQQPQAIQGGQVIQLGNPAATNTSLANAVQQHQAAAATTTTANSANSGNQNIIMMVPGATGGSPTIQRIPLPGMQEFFFIM